jgi:hypothetical protein
VPLARVWVEGGKERYEDECMTSSRFGVNERVVGVTKGWWGGINSQMITWACFGVTVTNLGVESV